MKNRISMKALLAAREKGYTKVAVYFEHKRYDVTTIETLLQNGGSLLPPSNVRHTEDIDWTTTIAAIKLK